MKRLSFITGLLVLLTIPAVAYSAINKIDYVKRMAANIDYAERHQKSVWPGFHPGSKPSIIAFFGENTNDAYAINLKPGKLNWQKITSSPYPIHYLKNSDLLGLNLGDEFVEIEGQMSLIDIQYQSPFEQMFSFPQMDNKFMAMHALHYLLFEASIDPSKLEKLKSEKSPYKDQMQIKLVYLEDSALAFSQKSDPTHAAEALRDALAIHQYRQKQLSPEMRDQENTNEFFMGVINYISLKSENLSDTNFKKISQRYSCAPLTALSEPTELSDCALFLMPAYSNTVYAHAIEKKLTGCSWKRDVIKQAKPISKVAMDYYHLSDEEARVITEQAMKNPNYNYDRINRLIDYVFSVQEQPDSKPLQ